MVCENKIPCKRCNYHIPRLIHLKVKRSRVKHEIPIYANLCSGDDVCCYYRQTGSAGILHYLRYVLKNKI